MKICRFQLHLSLLTSFLILIGMPAFGAQFKIATVAPEGTDWMRDMRAAAKEIKDPELKRVRDEAAKLLGIEINK